MQCEYQLRIYFNNNTCILENIEIDSIGMCSSCIIVNIQEEYLIKARQITRNRFQKIYHKQKKRK